MGVSTDAKLVWGFAVGDDGDAESDAGKLAEFMDERYDELQAIEKLGGALVYHCSDECTEYIVGLKETYTVGWRGYPQEIKSFDLPPEAQTKLDAVAKAFGLKSQPGKWLLCSYWG